MQKLFVKFGDKEHLEQMQKEGLFYCNTITYFSNLEDNYKRGDKYEAVTKVGNFENLDIEIKTANDPMGRWKRVKAKKTHFKEYYEKPMGNLFCMSAFDIKAGIDAIEFKFNENLFLFGKFGLVVMNQQIFFDRLNRKLEELQELKIKSESDFVKYLNLQIYSGEKTLFQKDDQFAFQEEFRIFFHTDKYGDKNPFIFSIGNIEDISQLIDLSETKSLFYRIPK